MKKGQKKYPMNVSWSEGLERFVASVPELPGCSGTGKDEVEAVKNARIAIDKFLLTAKSDPESTQSALLDRKFSGKILLRISEGLHREAFARAQKDRLSLNQLIESAIRKFLS